MILPQKIWLILFLWNPALALTTGYPCVALYPFFSTKSLYSNVNSGGLLKVSECQLKNVWAFVRNGAHYPTTEEIKEFREMVKIKKSILENIDKYHSYTLCDTEIKSFRNWTVSIKDDDALELTKSGYEELENLGKHIRSFLNDSINLVSKNILVRTTSDKEAVESANALLDGIFGNETIPVPLVFNDTLLKNEINCSAWQKSQNSQKLEDEISTLLKTPEVIQLKEYTKIRLGFLSDMSIEEIELMYSMCAYEHSWNPSQPSTWCATFNRNNLQILEYLNDLKLYYNYGYGNPFVKNLGCELLNDLIRTISTGEGVTLNFGNSLGLAKLIVALGLAGKDEPLTGGGYTNLTEREWRTSELLPYSANLIAVRVECSKGQETESKVAIFLNENVIGLPCSKDGVFCDLPDFIKIYQNLTDPSFCNRDFCNK